uniref:F-box domain-containing protein n=1 Tax=Oryza barthii TaxID=65489 RepID=A0A0D3ET28_9ORYZ
MVRLVDLLPPPFVPYSDDVNSDDDDSISGGGTEDEDGRYYLCRSLSHAVDRTTGLAESIERIPDDLLSKIITLLPTKEAPRTRILSRRWLSVCASTALFLDDRHFLSTDGCDLDINAIMNAMRTHEGSIHSVRITHFQFDTFSVRRLLESLDSRELKDLVLVNSVEDSHPEMPESLFRIRGLRCLCAGRWTFEDYSSLHLPSFGASLIEICFLSSDFTSNILGNLIVYCPRLEILSLFDVKLNCLKIESNSLQIMVIWNMMAKHIIIHDTANLERLLFDISKGSRQLCSITLLHTPCLEVLGVLDLSVHTLQIGEDLVEILAVAVQFWIDNETMMLPRILECFPCLETLHILLPTHLLSCNDLVSINIGAVAFPDTRGHRSAYMLESLRELELTWVTIATSDINMVLRCCKALERLFVIGHEAGRSSDAATRDGIIVQSGSLKALILWYCELSGLTILGASSNLERVVLLLNAEYAEVVVDRSTSVGVIGFLNLSYNRLIIDGIQIEVCVCVCAYFL